MILRCGATGAPAQQLSQVEHHIRGLLLEYSPPEAYWKPCAKLESRLGEILMLRGELTGAHAAFKRAEMIISDRDRQGAGNWKREASPFLGYGARRYLRLLCEMAQVPEFQDERASLLAHAEDLYNLNLRRLSRFPGEGPLLLLEQAWLRKLAGRADHADVLLQKLIDHPGTAAASMSVRVDIEATYARLAIELLESEESDAVLSRQDLARRAKGAIVSLLRIAKTGGLPIYQALGEAYGARWLGLSLADRDDDSSGMLDGRPAHELIESARRVFVYTECGLYLEQCKDITGV